MYEADPFRKYLPGLKLKTSEHVHIDGHGFVSYDHSLPTGILIRRKRERLRYHLKDTGMVDPWPPCAVLIRKEKVKGKPASREDCTHMEPAKLADAEFPDSGDDEPLPDQKLVDEEHSTDQEELVAEELSTVIELSLFPTPLECCAVRVTLNTQHRLVMFAFYKFDRRDESRCQNRLRGPRATSLYHIGDNLYGSEPHWFCCKKLDILLHSNGRKTSPYSVKGLVNCVLKRSHHNFLLTPAEEVNEMKPPMEAFNIIQYRLGIAGGLSQSCEISYFRRRRADGEGDNTNKAITTKAGIYIQKLRSGVSATMRRHVAAGGLPPADYIAKTDATCVLLSRLQNLVEIFFALTHFHRICPVFLAEEDVPEFEEEEGKHQSLHYIETRVAGIRANDADTVTYSMQTSGHGSVADDSIAPTIVTSSSVAAASVENRIPAEGETTKTQWVAFSW